ncbi:MAG: fructosamine kinase family protein [Gammaproteobacteria bacterium]
MPDWTALAGDIRQGCGLELNPDSAQPVTGGCINRSWRVDCDKGPVFIKTNSPERLEMFEAEADGLTELASADAVRVPMPLACGLSGDSAWLAIEWIEQGRPEPGSSALLGEGLARQHRHSAISFGWVRDNNIGSTPQENSSTDDWSAFFAIHRLGFQLDLIETGGFAGKLVPGGRRLVEEVPVLLAGHSPEPSLLHGDLWGGNWMCDTEGRPCIFDPAVYYGDREADIAMTCLFGGFDSDFHSAYASAWPLEPDFETRFELYNLYHVLNHVNLFGATYADQAEAMIGRLLAKLSA